MEASKKIILNTKPEEHPNTMVLLSTFDGERYLPAQLESLFRQTNQDWRLFVRDDCSSDRTLEIIGKASLENPGRIIIIGNSEGQIGAAQSFGRLMQASQAPYALFCDQDDIWHPDKIDKMLWAMKEMEGRLGPETPILIHSDLRVVADDLTLLESSFWRYQKLDPRRGEKYTKLLIQNVVTGSAAIINRALVQLAASVPDNAAMHDWWLALAAAAFGKIGFLSEPLVDYRQHPRNRIGAKEWDFSYVARMAFRRAEALKGLAVTRRQARAFLDRYNHQLDPELCTITEGYANLQKANYLDRRRFLLRYGITKTGLARNIGLFLWC